MKIKLLILAFLLAIVSPVLAQDTITGVVNRIAAPYFEQNVCDSRFAIISGNETFYVMVDHYWPNPYLEDLVIHYDTIPVGNGISVVGNIVELEDENGETSLIFDISKNLNSNHQQILAFFSYNNIAFSEPTPVSATSFTTGFDTYFITINGNLQTQYPFIINGRGLVNGKRYLFIGVIDTLTNYYGNPFVIFELADALPYDVADTTVSGTLTMENDLYLSLPCNETQYLSLYDGDKYFYLTNKRRLKNDYINDALFQEGDSVTIGGFVFVRHDLFGAPFNTMEIVKIQSTEERTLTGLVHGWGMPYINSGIPIPGIYLALIYENNGQHEGYYIMKPNGGFYSDEDFYIVDNDTIHVSDQQVSVTFIPNICIDNWINPYYQISINDVDFNEHIEIIPCTLTIEENPLYFGNTLAVKTQDNNIYYLKPYIYTHTAPDHITIGNNTIYVGDEFWATGTVSTWYDSDWGLHQIIDITSVEFAEVEELHISETQVFPNPSNGIIIIESEKQMKSITAYDYSGKFLCLSNNNELNIKGYKGLVTICIVFQDGLKTIKKTVIK